MDDLISRQAAIDAVEFGITSAKVINIETGEWKELFEESNEELRKAVNRLKELPPAQPSIPIEWIEEYSSKIDSEHETISACAIDDMLGAWREEKL